MVKKLIKNPLKSDLNCKHLLVIHKIFLMPSSGKNY